MRLFNSSRTVSGGEISGQYIKLKATDTLTNRGYILGEDINIDAKTLDNGKRKADYYAIEHGDGYWVEITGQKVQDGGVIAHLPMET